MKNGKGSRFSIEDGRNQQSHTSVVTSTSASGHRDDATCACALTPVGQVMQIPMFLTVAREHEREGCSQSSRMSKAVPLTVPQISPLPVEGNPGLRTCQQNFKIRGRSSERPIKDASGGDRLGEDVDDVAHSEESRCECHFPGSTPARIEPF